MKRRGYRLQVLSTLGAREIVSVFLGLIVALLARVARADRIVLTSGRSVDNVEILVARWDEIQYKVGQSTNTLKGEDVFEIERDSRTLAPIRQAIEEGDFEGASERISRTRGREWEQAELGYLKGKVARLRGDPAAAIAALEAYLGEHGEAHDWWTPYAVYEVGLAAIDSDNAASALEHFQKLSEYGSAWEIRSLLGQAKAQLVGGKLLEARKLFDQVANNRRAPASLRQEATVGRAEVMIVQKQYKQAVKALEDEFFEPSIRPDEALYGEARARATLLMGTAARLQDDLYMAEIWYLRCALLFRKHGGVYREACQALVEVYTQLGNQERAAEWKERASGRASAAAQSDGQEESQNKATKSSKRKKRKSTT